MEVGEGRQKSWGLWKLPGCLISLGGGGHGKDGHGVTPERHPKRDLDFIPLKFFR